MAMAATDIERLIRASIPDAKVTIRDLAGDGDHYAATVIAESFRGKSRVQQHKIVYDALKGEMGGKLHALALQTGTPEGPCGSCLSSARRIVPDGGRRRSLLAVLRRSGMGYRHGATYCSVKSRSRRGGSPRP